MDYAYCPEKENGNNYREDNISEKTNNTRVEFNILNGDEKIPPAHQFMRCHMIFDININNFNSKARYTSGTHTTEPPSSIIFVSTVSRKRVRIALTMAALNALMFLRVMYKMHICRRP